MLKLYRFSNLRKEYWETWKNKDGTHTIHWGELGTRGRSKTVKEASSDAAHALIQKEIDARVKKGFAPKDDHVALLIEYKVEGMGTAEDLEKRHRLQDRMNETLGWTGLGACDGGSIGSGTMEVCNFVVDFELAKSVIAADLEDTEFSDYTRMYAELD